MRAWYIPSFAGDLRLTVDPDGGSRLEIEKPTLAEQEVLKRLGPKLIAKGWIAESEWQAAQKNGVFGPRKRRLLLSAAVEEVGPTIASMMRPGPAVLTAITLRGGRIITCSGSPAELADAVAGTIEDGKGTPENAPEKAATVKRPTPSCPHCIRGAIGPASDVLLEFLDDEQHASWARDRSIVVHGHLSGHRYRIAHRKSALAERFGRICYDIDSDAVVHFHLDEVPPEEEVLAAKLILEHREPWLRNEATMLGLTDHDQHMVFKNPFGGLTDGIPDARLTTAIGVAVAGGVIGLAVYRGVVA